MHQQIKVTNVLDPCFKRKPFEIMSVYSCFFLSVYLSAWLAFYDRWICEWNPIAEGNLTQEEINTLYKKLIKFLNRQIA